MRLQKFGFYGMRSNRVPLSRFFLILISIGLLSSLVGCTSTPDAPQEEAKVEVVAPLKTTDDKPVVEGAETQEVNTAIKCDGKIDEDGKIIENSGLTPEREDDCDKIVNIPYFQSSADSPESGSIYYRESEGAPVIMIHDHYTPSPSFWYIGSGPRTVIMPYNMMYSSGRPVIQGSRPVIATFANTATVSRTPVNVTNGRATVTPVKSTASFSAPLTSTSINGGKVTAAHITSSSSKVSVPSSSVTTSSRAPSSRSSVSSSAGRGVSAGHGSSGSTGG